MFSQSDPFLEVRCKPSTVSRFESLMTVYIKIEWFVSAEAIGNDLMNFFFLCFVLRNGRWCNEGFVIESHTKETMSTPENSNWSDLHDWVTVSNHKFSPFIVFKPHKYEMRKILPCGPPGENGDPPKNYQHASHVCNSNNFLRLWPRVLFLIRIKSSLWKARKRQHEAECSTAKNDVAAMERWVVIKAKEKNVLNLQWNLIEIHELPLGNGRTLVIILCSPT